MANSVTLNGFTFNAEDFDGTDGFGYDELINYEGEQVDRFIAIFKAYLDTTQKQLQATSTSSVTIGTGDKTFVLAENPDIVPGGFWVAADANNPTTNFMVGQAKSYDSGTQTLVITVDSTTGSGTISDWELQIVGKTGEAGQGAGSGGTTRTISSDLNLSSSDEFAQHIQADAAGLVVTLPDATGLNNGLAFMIYNRGLTGNTLQINDNDGNLLVAELGGQEGVFCVLHDNGTTAGVWSIPSANQVTALSGEVNQATEISTDSLNSWGVAMITSTVGIAFGDDNTAGAGKARAIDFSTDPVTLLGSELTVEAVDIRTASQSTGQCIVAIDSSNVLVVYNDDTNSRGRAAILNWNGSTLSIQDGPFTFDTDDISDPSVDHLSGDKYLVVAYNITTSNMEAWVLDTASLTISVDAGPTQISANDVFDVSVKSFDGTYAIAFGEDTTENDMTAYLVKFSGGTITVPDSLDVESTSGADTVFVITLDASTAITGFHHDADGKLYFDGISFDSGTETLSSSGRLEFNELSTSGFNDLTMMKINSTDFWAAWHEPDVPAPLFLKRLSYDGSTINEVVSIFNGDEEGYLDFRMANSHEVQTDIPFIADDQNNSNFVTAGIFTISKLQQS